MNLINNFKKLKNTMNRIISQKILSEQNTLILGKILSENVKSKTNISSLSEVEFKVFSQWGDDGIIQWLTNNIEFPNRTFVEFGVEDYSESNTRFLMTTNNWSGLVIDGSESNIKKITLSENFWKYNLTAVCAFIDTENINNLLSSAELDKEVGILHIDLDGNDYWIWKEINVISPIVVILEYNSVFGIEEAITVPYDKDFLRENAHYSNLYFGASLRALHQLSGEKGYSFIGCNSAGNNAYFVRTDYINDVICEIPLEAGYVISLFRESRDREGNLTFLSGADRIEKIRGLPVYNTENNQIEKL